jgi:hypothetical protein
LVWRVQATSVSLDRDSKEMIMNTLKLTLLAVAIVVGIPVASAFAANRFSDDWVAVQPAQVLRVADKMDIKRLGLDSLPVAKDALPARPEPLPLSGIVPIPRRV